MDLTQLLLLKQQEVWDAKSEAAEKAREVETLQARRLAEVDRDGSVSHISSSASDSAPLSPQQWPLGCGVALRGRSKFEEAKASVDPYPEVLSQGSPVTSLPADPVSSTPIAATSTASVRSRLLSPPPCGAVCCGVQSKSQERPPGADQIANAVARPRGAVY